MSLLTTYGYRYALGLAILVTALIVCVVNTFDRNNSLSGKFESLAGLQQRSQSKAQNKQFTVVCMIFTTPDNWDSRGRAVQNTWAKRCPIPIFFYSREAAKPINNVSHPITLVNNAVALDVPEGRHHLTGKTMAALRYSFKQYGNVTDWFLKADDDTYIIWENMLCLLSEHNSSVATYTGSVFDTHLKHGYTSGGAGYLISKPGVNLMLTEGLKHPGACPQDGGLEDVDIGRCLEKLGIYPKRTIGKDGKIRMHWSNPLTLLHGDPSHASWFYFTWEGGVQVGNPQKNASDHVMSRDTVTFHYVTPGQMYMFDFLLYKLRRRQTSSSSSNSC